MSYSREEVKAITDKVLNMAKADAVEVRFSGGERSATRYANSTITANLVEHDQEVLITVYYGQKSATHVDAPVRRCVAEVGDRAGAGAGEAAAGQSGADAAGQAAAGLSGDRRRAAAGGRVRTGRARAPGQAERRRLREERRARRRLHPQAALDRRARELRRAVRVLPLRRGELHPDLPDAGRHRIRLGRARPG